MRDFLLRAVDILCGLSCLLTALCLPAVLWEDHKSLMFYACFGLLIAAHSCFNGTAP